MNFSFLEMSEINFFVYIAIFIGALLAFDGLRQLITREEDAGRAINRRMRMMKAGASSEDIQALLIKANEGVGNRSLVARANRILKQAGLNVNLYRALAFTLFASFVIFLIAQQFVVPPAAFALSLVLGFVLPALVVVAVRERRLQKLTSQLPDALDLMARGLEVGHPLSVTVGNVASDMPDPIGSEFGLIQDQVNYGDDITDAFADFAKRVDTEDVRYTSVSIGIQHGTGGNLAKVLRVLATVIRDRATMRRKIKAISAEGRLSALILSIVPFVIFGVINLTSPSFYGEVMDDPIFKFFAITVLVLIALQALILFRMVNFKF